MINYDPEKPLISLHIPKCGGHSLGLLLKRWYGKNFFTHYFQEANALPPRHPQKPGVCIHGHFNRSKGFGVSDYYPRADQFITVLKNPLEIAISNYYFWKRKARQRQLKLEIIQEGGEHDYRNIDDFFNKRPKSPITIFFPVALTSENYKQVIESKFVWIGLLEDIQEHVDILAKRLGGKVAPPEMYGIPLPWIIANSLGYKTNLVPLRNSSVRDEKLSPSVREEFIHNNQLEFEIYQYLKERWNTGILEI